MNGLFVVRALGTGLQNVFWPEGGLRPKWKVASEHGEISPGADPTERHEQVFAEKNRAKRFISRI